MATFGLQRWIPDISDTLLTGIVFAFRVYMRCVTWSRDSHGLFDYESRYINKKNIRTATDGRIVRLNNDIELIGID